MARNSARDRNILNLTRLKSSENKKVTHFIVRNNKYMKQIVKFFNKKSTDIYKLIAKIWIIQEKHLNLKE